jgi:hypothetical protein
MYLMKETFICENCNTPFEVFPSRVKHATGKIRFCSKKCYREFQSTRVELVCVVCGIKYDVIPCRATTSKYCSEECRIKGFVSLERTEDWNKNIAASNSGKVFTDEHCERIRVAKMGCHYDRDENYSKAISKALKGNPNVIASAQRGPKSRWWKGGITPLNHQIRDSTENKNWVDSVFTRDDFVCQSCGHRGGNMEAHHIITFSDIMRTYKVTTFMEAQLCKQLWDVANGETLCKKCHKKKHTIKEEVGIYGPDPSGCSSMLDISGLGIRIKSGSDRPG